MGDEARWHETDLVAATESRGLPRPAAASVRTVERVAVIGLPAGEQCFALRLGHLHPDPDLDSAEVLREAVALITALEGQRSARFVLQTLCQPDREHPERGSLSVHLIATVRSDAAGARIEELSDDLLDMLSAPPVRFTFAPVSEADELATVIDPFPPQHFAEIARREEPCQPTRWIGGIGFGADGGERTGERPIWSMWTLGPPSGDLRRLASVLLAQEAPVCIRVVLEPTIVTEEEREIIESLTRVVESRRGDGLVAASLNTIESVLFLRPIFEMRCLVASSDRLSPSMLSALGHAVSEPTPHGAPEPILHGGFSVLRGYREVPLEELAAAYTGFVCGEPTPSLAPSGLDRIRRLVGAWEAANVFRIPVTADDGFPGIETLRVPDLDVPLADLARSGSRVGNLVGDPTRAVLVEADERFRHMYVSGQTGTGKSTLLLNLALQDIAAGSGVAVVDPHGDLVEAILGRIPPNRIDDVVLIDPADPYAVVGVNLLEAETPVQREYVVSELALMFYSIFDPKRQGFVGPRFEAWLRQAALLLLANPDEQGTVLDIATVFVDDAVRKHLVKSITDPVLAEFWIGEMGKTNSHSMSEMIGWFRSKFEVFSSSALVRNVVGQANSTISFSEVLSDRRILLVNLSKGLLGEYNSALLGHIIFGRLWLAALERASMPESERSDFFVYLDEFQNMTTESLPSVLSEARKFRLGITLANQFFSQVPELTRDALMGNVGSRITFRTGPGDAPLFSTWLGEEVDPHDLIGMPNHMAVAALSDKGVPIAPFPFRTQPPIGEWDAGVAERVRDRSRERWARPVPEIEAALAKRWGHVDGSFADWVQQRDDAR